MALLLVPFNTFVSAVLYASSTAVAPWSVKVSGTVQDKNGEPIIGATVLEKGTNNGTSTDRNGKFTLEVAGPGSVLRITYVGYKPIEQPVGLSATFSITLLEEEKLMDEVVVIGYGTQRKGDVTSAVSSVKKEDFLVGNIQDAAELVKGKVAGLTVTKGSGDPNAESTIRLRGITSLIGSISPLILIDGIEGSLSTVAPENIESFDVLKDASAAAIYGTRGANGVILITTNAGKRQEETHVTYSGYGSLSHFAKLADFMDPGDVRKGLTAYSDKGWDTDWVSAISRIGYTQNHSLSISGGTRKTSYSGNLAYRQEEGTIKRSNNDELKMQFDLSHWMFDDKVKLNFNMVKGMHENDVTNASSGGIANIYRQAVIRNPTAPIYIEGDPNRDYYEDFAIFQYFNPVAMINENVGETKREWTRITGSVTLEPVKGWQTNLKLSTNRSNGNTESYSTKDYYTSTTAGYNGYAYKGSNYAESDQLEMTSKYENNFNGMHRLSALAGYSYQYDMYESMSASNYNFPTDAYLYNNISMGAALKEGKAGMGSYKEDSKLISFFGRVSYGYLNKYNLLMSVRHEGSSKFGVNHKWGTFPAISAGWTISNEEFMQGQDWISNLRLRMGYGVTGVIPGSSYMSFTTYNYNSTSWGYYLNSAGVWSPSLEVTSNSNPNLKWEKSGEFNVGLEFGFLDGLIGGSLDYYNKITNDLLYSYNVPSPPNLFTSTYANVGTLQNQGIELMISATPVKTENFTYITTLTASHNTHKLLSLSNDLYETDNYVNTGYAGDPVSLPTQRLEVGSSFGRYWTLKTTGLSANGLWMVENPATGKYEEWNASMSNDDYRQWMGSAIPKVYLGWNNAFRWKKFDLNLQMSSQLGFQIVNEQRMFYENNSIAYNRLETAANLIPIVDENGQPTGETRALSSAQSQTIVSWYYENGAFLKMDYLTLGYNFDTSKMKYVNNIRLYLSGENLFCLTNYSGMDPELSNADIWSMGIDGRDKYPTIRSITIGANINFK
ncbi:MAG TPA: SusC/RagA family TonB-linked outer membrane protein [Bacteroidales bacterium]|nr:SusC/RagA family TonB-linked outer membrane protein [Bacteroidales bacterium]